MDSSKKNACSSVHRAGWILADQWTAIQDGFISTENGFIKEIGNWSGTKPKQVVDHGTGALMPVLVNTHTHLELTALKGSVPPEEGFGAWVKELIKKRDAIGDTALSLSADNGLKELIRSGCGVIGEISTLDLTWNIVSKSGLSGIWFKEFLGNNINKNLKPGRSTGNMAVSFAGHAPHTSSPALLVFLKSLSRKKNLPFSIHLAESEEELTFISKVKGDWADFLTARGIDFSGWNLPAETPVRHLEKLKILDKKTIAVHLTFAGKKDFDILANNRVSVCLCPRSNFNLNKKLPDIYGMLKAGIKPCLGTDSLASVESLSMFDEMAYTSSAFPFLAPEIILSMATKNGAEAIGLKKKFGTLMPGKKATFLYVPVKASNKADLLDAIVNADFTGNCKIVRDIIC